MPLSTATRLGPDDVVRPLGGMICYTRQTTDADIWMVTLPDK